MCILLEKVWVWSSRVELAWNYPLRLWIFTIVGWTSTHRCTIPSYIEYCAYSMRYLKLTSINFANRKSSFARVDSRDSFATYMILLRGTGFALAIPYISNIHRWNYTGAFVDSALIICQELWKNRGMEFKKISRYGSVLKNEREKFR